MQASTEAVAACWPSKTEHASRCVHQWATTYLSCGTLPLHAQGRHSKRESLLDDEDIKESCLQWLRSSDPKTRSPAGLKMELESKILPDKLGVEGKAIGLTTIIKYMWLWGFAKKRSGQQVCSNVVILGVNGLWLLLTYSADIF